MRIIVGTDEGLRRGARAELASRVDAVEVMDADTFSRARLLSFAGTTGLFGERYGVVLDRVAADAAARVEFLAALKELAPDAAVVVYEESADRDLRARLAACGVAIEEGRSSSKPPAFSPFALTDAVAARDKKQAWVRWQEAIAAGEDPYYLLAMIAWQLRSVLLAVRFNREESGMKPFVYDKARRSASRFASGELEALSRACVELHAASRTTDSADVSLLAERFLLSL